MSGYRALQIPPYKSSKSANFPVLSGKGWLSGDQYGAIARSFLQAGMIRISEPEGIGNNPVFYTLNSNCEIARFRIDLSADQIEIPFEGELNDVEITSIALFDFSAVPETAIQLGVYSYKKENGEVYPITEIMPETTFINPVASPNFTTIDAPEMDMFKFVPKPRIRKLVELWAVLKVKSTVPLFATISIRAEPNWMKTWAGL